jgi:hypothetical protein
LAARRAVILSRTGRPALGNSLVGKGGIYPATGQAARQAAAIAVRTSATEGTEAQREAQGAAISRAAVAETGMRLEAAPEDITDRLHAPTATVAPRAWDLEGEGEAAVVVVVGAVGAGKRPGKGGQK